MTLDTAEPQFPHINGNIDTRLQILVEITGANVQVYIAFKFNM